MSLVWSVLLLASAKVVVAPILAGRKIFAPLYGTGSKQLFRDGEVVDISKGTCAGDSALLGTRGESGAGDSTIKHGDCGQY